MLTKIKIVFLSGLLLFSIGALIAPQANALYLDVEFDTVFPDKPSPGGSAPWITARFDDSVGDANTVRLTMTAVNLMGDENISELYFNFDTSLDASLMNFTVVDNSDSNPVSISNDINGNKADGDGYYDILFEFPPPPGDQANRFTNGETVVYDLVFNSAISALSFDFMSTERNGSLKPSKDYYYAGAHIQQINSTSTWVGASTTTVVPEPISATLFIAGSATLGFRRFRKNRKA